MVPTYRNLVFGLALALGWLLARGEGDANPRPGAARERADESAAPVKFPINPTRPWYYGKIEQVETAGTVEISPAREMTRDAELSEGLYLAIVHDLPRPSLKSPRLVRIEVIEVLERGAARLSISRDAAQVLKSGEFLTLFRPAAMTTSAMKAFPDRVIQVEGDVPWPKSETEVSLCFSQSLHNLKIIAPALHGYHAAFDRFPPAVVFGPDGKPWHSWRVLLLPYLDRADLYTAYHWDEPWDGPNNKKLLSKMPKEYSDPIYGENQEYFTHYTAISGSRMAFSQFGVRFDGKSLDPSKLHGTSIRDFTDSTSDSLLVGPIGPDREIPWMKPEDVVVGKDFPPLGKAGSFATPYPTKKGNAGPFVRADGSVVRIPRGIDYDEFRAALTISGGEVVSWNVISGGDLPPGRVLVPVIHVTPGTGIQTVRLVMEEMELLGAILPPTIAVEGTDEDR